MELLKDNAINFYLMKLIRHNCFEHEYWALSKKDFDTINKQALEDWEIIGNVSLAPDALYSCYKSV
jgi:hypothetical protein